MTCTLITQDGVYNEVDWELERTGKWVSHKMLKRQCVLEVAGI